LDVPCTQCGASVTVEADKRLLECPYCSTALVVDAEGTLFHEMMLPTVKLNDVGAHLRRFLGGRDTVANLDKEARLDDPVLEYFPFWAFTIAGSGGERVVLEPAAPSSLQGLQGLTLPTGTTRPMSSDAVGEVPARDPEIPVSTAREWLEQRHGEDLRVRRTVLYHLPLYSTPYSWKGRSYRAAVDGVSGKVFPADFPAKAEAPYMLVAVLALLVFGIEGLLIENILLKAIVYLLSAFPILGIAWLTTRKV
jgi:hypothetical protein